LSLQNSAHSPDISNEQTDNFAGAINSILSNDTMKEMCCENEELSEKITGDILDFVNKTKKLIDKTENPFENECNLLKQFEKTNENAFKTIGNQ
jgi:hypothetical protein